VNGIVSSVRSRDQELGIEDARIAIDNIGNLHRVHVMDNDVQVDVVPIKAEIATHVSSDDVMTNLTPLSGRVELLIHVAIKPEGRATNIPAKG
jgi:hypothetical protein